MARHTIFTIALLATLTLLVAHTCASSSSRREEEWQESCQKQIQKLNLKHCEKHLMKRIEKAREDEDEDEEENVLRMRGINYIRGSRNKESEEEEEGQKEKCCRQLSEVNILDCRCQALQEIKEKLSDRLQGKKEMGDMEKELKMLPLRCGIAPPLGCDLSSSDDD